MASFFHVYRPEGVISKYRLIGFDDAKEAFIPLTDFYHDQINRISENSVISYLNTLELRNLFSLLSNLLYSNENN
ncbi:MAG: integrase [Paenibacillus sp.]|jgi:hypothetical protein|nr:integrase [Paenibacillus sp.]